MATIASQGFVLPANPPRPCKTVTITHTPVFEVTVVWRVCK